MFSGEWGTVSRPVRTAPGHPIDINDPDGFMTDPPGDLWWTGLRSDWQSLVPASVTRAVAVIVNPLCRMPWIVTGPGGVRLEPGDDGYPTWLIDPMLLNGSSGGPSRSTFGSLDRLSAFDLWSRWVSTALCWGRGVFQFTPDAAGQPIAGTVKLVDPSRLRRSEGQWTYELDGSMEPVSDEGMCNGQRFVMLRHRLPGGVFGYHRQQIALAQRITGYGAESLDSSVPSGVLSTDQPINQTQADQIRNEFEMTQARRRVAVLGNGANYSAVLASPVDVALVEMARLSNEQIAHMFELNAWQLDAANSSLTYETKQDNRQEFVDGTLASWSARIEQTLGALMPWGTDLSIDFTAYTMPTTQESNDGPSDPA